MTEPRSATAGTDFADLHRLFNPRHVAVIGASDDGPGFGTIATANLLESSAFDGRVSLVSPTRDAVFGRPTLSAVGDLDEDVDVALVLVGRHRVIPVLEELAERRTAQAVVFASGFGESDDDGRELERAMAALRGSGLRIVGPNSPGLANFGTRVGLTIQPGFADEVDPGAVGLVAQSGGLTRGLLQGNARGIGFSAFVSPGNQVDLDLSDYIVHLAGDPGTKVLAVASEGVADPERFEAAAEVAGSAGVPIVMLKIGRSGSGRTAASSHTGALVGSYDATRAIARRHGVALVEDVEELLVVAAHLTRDVRPAPGVAVFGMSGGAGVLVADQLGTMGRDLVDLDGATIEALAAVSGPGPVPRNPVDIGGAAMAGDAYRSGLQAVVDDPGVGIVVATLNAWYREHTGRFVDVIADVAAATPVPIVPVWMSPRRDGELARLDAAGLPPATSTRAAAGVVEALVSVGERQGRPDDRSSTAVARGTALADLVGRAGVDAGAVMTEAVAKRCLGESGLSVAAEQVCGGLDEALELVERIGFPVIVKGVSPAVLHREGTGMVSGPVGDVAELERVVGEVERASRATVGSDAFEILVASFVESVVEAHVGMVVDPEWGALFSVGLGGRAIELIRDSTLVGRRPSRAEVVDAIGRTALAGQYARRCPTGTALEALADVLETVAWFVEGADDVTELDLNPVLLTKEQAVIVDALIVRDAPASAVR